LAGALRCCRCLKTHADALRNLVVTAVFREEEEGRFH